MASEILQDVKGALSNLGNEDGVVLEVKIDNASLYKLLGGATLIGFAMVGLNQLLKNIWLNLKNLF